MPPLAGRTIAALVATVVTSLVGQVLLHHGLGRMSPTAGALGTATSVVTAAVAEAVLVGTTPPPRMIGAAALML